MNLVIFGLILPSNKKVIYALSRLYGIGHSSAKLICQDLSLLPELKIKDLTERQQYAIAKKIKDEFIVLGKFWLL